MVKEAPHIGMLAGGISLFLVGYIVTIAVNFGVCDDNIWEGCEENGKSFIPFAGPFTFLAHTETADGYYALMALLGIVQIAGGALGTAGVFVKQERPAKPGEDGRVDPGDKPGQMRPEPEGDMDYRYIVMPMHL